MPSHCSQKKIVHRPPRSGLIRAQGKKRGKKKGKGEREGRGKGGREGKEARKEGGKETGVKAESGNHSERREAHSGHSSEATFKTNPGESKTWKL